LGYGAARALLSEPSDQYPERGGLICLVGSDIRVIPFDQMRDPVTGRTRVRTVDVEGESYLVARKYMIRLEKTDLADREMKRRLAEAAGLTSDEFVDRFGKVVELAGAVQ
jgi:6-phosphofructokinase 1